MDVKDSWERRHRFKQIRMVVRASKDSKDSKVMFD